jgi:2-methylcitrate dehydratase PrpD
MSIPYAVAAALARGRASVAEYTNVVHQDPGLWDLERRVRVQVDSRFPERGSPSTVELTLTDGRVVTASVDEPRGSLAWPASSLELTAKFRELAALAIPASQVTALEALVTGPALLDETAALWTVLQPR